MTEERIESAAGTEDDEASVEFDLAWLLGQVLALISQGMEQQLKDSPISSEGLGFLSTVMMLGDDATPGQLARWMVRKPNTISSMTTRLEEKGFVEKKKMTGANNRPYIKIVVTEKGRRFLGAQWGAGLLSAAFAGFTPEEKRHLRRLLIAAREGAGRGVSDYQEPPFPSLGKPSPYGNWKWLR